MAAKHSRHIALTAPLLRYVESEVALGNYTSISEIVRVALRFLKERDDAAMARLIDDSAKESLEIIRAKIG